MAVKVKRLFMRDTYKYLLKDGNKIVYVGITNDLERRETEHRQDKNFATMEVVGRRCSRESAERWETNRIETYMDNHKGETPKFNQTTYG